MKRALLAGAATGALLAGMEGAAAGGFALREQSTVSQGASFAGDAAGSTLSSMFWNNAATAAHGGLNLESGYALIIPDAMVTVDTIGGRVPAGDPNSQIADLALVPSSYFNFQFKNFDPNLFLGLSINSPFGLATKPDDNEYAGAQLGRRSSLFTTNFNPNIAYRVAPGFMVGVGLQAQYNDGTFKFATGAATGPNTYFQGQDVSIGATAGVLWQPSKSTSIGLGWRSAMNVELEGTFASNGLGAGLAAGVAASVDVKLPDIVTLSIIQSITPTTRLMGTVEWSNWSRFNELRVISDGTGPTVFGATAPGQTIALIESNWSDGWFFSLGGEYDYSQKLTLRAGVAYEISPVDDPSKRIIGIPDSDRIWLSVGASYKLSPTMSIDLAYTHIFLDDARFDRPLLGAPATIVSGSVDASTDIVSIGLRTKLGAEEQPLK